TRSMRVLFSSGHTYVPGLNVLVHWPVEHSEHQKTDNCVDKHVAAVIDQRVHGRAGIGSAKQFCRHGYGVYRDSTYVVDDEAQKAAEQNAGVDAPALAPEEAREAQGREGHEVV